MKILIYSQAIMSMGGSTRLLTNLAKHLARRHEVTFAVANAYGQAFIKTLATFDHQYVLISDVMSGKTPVCADVMVCHYPYGLDNMASLKGMRKVAVILEIPDVVPIPIDTDNHHLFEDIIFLHDLQVANIPEVRSGVKFHKLRVVNDIDYAPMYRKTEDAGCIKNEFSTLHTIIRGSSEIRYFRIYYSGSPLLIRLLNFFCCTRSLFAGVQKPFISFDDKPDRERLRKALQFLAVCHRVRIMELEHNIQKLFDSFDCLIRTPRHSIGASISVHDALACGKAVVLSDTSEHRRSFSQFKGVFFVNNGDGCLNDVVRSYDAAAFKEIRDCYLSVYDRERVLSEWEEIVAA